MSLLLPFSGLSDLLQDDKMKENEITNVIVNTAAMIDLYLLLYFEVIYKDTIFYKLCQRLIPQIISDIQIRYPVHYMADFAWQEDLIG